MLYLCLLMHELVSEIMNIVIYTNAQMLNANAATIFNNKKSND